jgi:hypothetical protein
MRHPFLRALLPALLVVVAGRELQQVEITAAPTVYRTLLLLFRLIGCIAKAKVMTRFVPPTQRYTHPLLYLSC